MNQVDLKLLHMGLGWNIFTDKDCFLSYDINEYIVLFTAVTVSFFQQMPFFVND